MKSEGILEFTKQVDAIDGYTPVGIVGTGTNHEWSFTLMQAKFDSGGSIWCTWMNLNKNQWDGAVGEATVLYLRS